MARGTDPLNDPRWEGQDSMSLPDRPAHPDPSRTFEHTSDPDGAPTHGIHGHVDAKHGQVSKAEHEANQKALKELDRKGHVTHPATGDGPADEVAKDVLDGKTVDPSKPLGNAGRNVEKLKGESK